MERFGFPSHRGISVRSILTFALLVVVTALLWVIIGSQTTQALPGGDDASWSGDSIIYAAHGFTKTNDFKDPSGTVPAGATVYQAPIQTTQGSSLQKAFIIYFSPGVDPPTATTAKYIEFDYSASKTLSNPQNAKDITLTLKGEETQLSSCSVDGIGWIICPVSVFIAGGMDWVFNVLATMISVQPSVVGDSNNSMYVAWNVMRNVANVAFVIVFLIIIYSQLTNFGVSNYGLKKLIPRLIVAAVLVNISFIVSAVAIDISNILGYSVQDIFSNIGKDLFNLTSDNFAGANQWSALTGVVLAGGGVIGGTYFVASGGVYLLIPLLVGLILTLIFVVIVLAARQAIIVILVIISPIAFVANLLPNTEKWFGKWRDLFMTMLIFFPAFSLVFGGSQLAGQLIIQNAGDNIIMVIFGLAVQIAPLVITPLLLKLSGSLLGKIAQIANNPSKGILDRNKNWANAKAEEKKQKTLSKNRSWANVGGKLMQMADNGTRKTKDRTELYKMRADNKYHKSKAHEKIHEKQFEAEVDKQIIDNDQKIHIQGKINKRTSTLHLQNAQLEAGKRALETSVKITESDTKEYDAGRTPAGASSELKAAITTMQASRQSTTIETMRAQNADQQIQREFAEALSKKTIEAAALRTRAGGIKPEPFGADSVLASAVSAVRRADAENIKNIQDASDIPPGRLDITASKMIDAIREGDSIKARAYQNMLVTAGGAGMEQFRTTMIDLKDTIPTDVAELMRDNMLSNHGGLKAKSNDLIEWAAKGGLLQEATYKASMWAGLSDMDFITQHPKSQAYAFENITLGTTNAFTKDRATTILEADATAGNLLTEDIKEKLRSIR